MFVRMIIWIKSNVSVHNTEHMLLVEQWHCVTSSFELYISIQNMYKSLATQLNEQNWYKIEELERIHLALNRGHKNHSPDYVNWATIANHNNCLLKQLKVGLLNYTHFSYAIPAMLLYSLLCHCNVSIMLKIVASFQRNNTPVAKKLAVLNRSSGLKQKHF